MEICNKWQPIETCPEGIAVDVLMERNGKYETNRVKKHKGKFYYFLPSGIHPNLKAGGYAIDLEGINVTHWQNTAAVFAS